MLDQDLVIAKQEKMLKPKGCKFIFGKLYHDQNLNFIQIQNTIILVLSQLVRIEISEVKIIKKN
jgi:hypothetical protein